MEREIICYDKTFDYEDMKIAMVVSEFINNHENDIPYQYLEDYEDLINLCIEIKTKWLELSQEKALSLEEYAYIQFFADNYLLEKFGLKTPRI